MLATKITNAGVKAISELCNLTELCLVGTNIDDSGIQYLQRMTGLEQLFLEATKLTNAGLAAVGKLTNLEILSIHNSHIDEHGLVHLTKLKKLRTFYLCTEVTRSSVPLLKKLSSLEILYIGDIEDDTRELLQAELPDTDVY